MSRRALEFARELAGEQTRSRSYHGLPETDDLGFAADLHGSRRRGMWTPRDHHRGGEHHGGHCCCFTELREMTSE